MPSCKQQWPHEDHWHMPNPRILPNITHPIHSKKDMKQVIEAWSNM